MEFCKEINKKNLVQVTKYPSQTVIRRICLKDFKDYYQYIKRYD